MLKVRARFWLEIALASLSGCLALLTVFGRGWIEAVIGFDPDHDNGAVEWAIVVGLLLVCLALGLLARSEWGRPRPALVAGS